MLHVHYSEYSTVVIPQLYHGYIYMGVVLYMGTYAHTGYVQCSVRVLVYSTVQYYVEVAVSHV